MSAAAAVMGAIARSRGSAAVVQPGDFFSPAITPGSPAFTNTREFNTLAATEFDTANAEGWRAAGEGQSSNLSIVTDATAPLSPSNVHRLTYPANFGDGSSPSFPSAQYSEGFGDFACRGFYLRLIDKPSANFRGQASTTKRFFACIGDGGEASGSNDIFGRFPGVGRVSDLSFALNTQNRFGGARSWSRNVGSAGDDTIFRDDWNLIEVYVHLESAVGQSDAVIQVAVNGVLIIDIDDERLLDTGEDDFVWTHITLDATWGGEDGEVVNDDGGSSFTLDTDHAVIMGVL